MNEKKKVAFFDFACCEGCQLVFLQLMEEGIFDVLKYAEFVTWREVMTEKADEYDVAFCEGSITREEDLERIREIRDKSKVLVALGTCASIGCHNALKNRFDLDEMMKIVYQEKAKQYKKTQKPIAAKPITAAVEVDYQIRGCPVSLPELHKALECIFTERKFHPSNQPVCVECKLKDNLCVYEKGKVCLGPLTRCGCDAICTTYGDACQGCRGLVDFANTEGFENVLKGGELHRIMAEAVNKNQLSSEDIYTKLQIYNFWPNLKLATEESRESK